MNRGRTGTDTRVQHTQSLHINAGRCGWFVGVAVCFLLLLLVVRFLLLARGVFGGLRTIMYVRRIKNIIRKHKLVVSPAQIVEPYMVRARAGTDIYDAIGANRGI